MKIAWVTLWFLTADGQSTSIVQYIPETGDPMKRCEMTRQAILDQSAREGLDLFFLGKSWRRGYLVCVPWYIEDGK